MNIFDDLAGIEAVRKFQCEPVPEQTLAARLRDFLVEFYGPASYQAVLDAFALPNGEAIYIARGPWGAPLLICERDGEFRLAPPVTVPGEEEPEPEPAGMLLLIPVRSVPAYTLPARQEVDGRRDDLQKCLYRIALIILASSIISARKKMKRRAKKRLLLLCIRSTRMVMDQLRNMLP